MKLENLVVIFGASIEVRYPDINGNWMYSMNGEVKEGSCLAGVCGRGKTIEESRSDYIQQIAGKTVVFNAMDPGYRKELNIPKDIE